ncbi:MAG: hypothetical protein J6M21_06375 [Campylobacter sp.]|nr:hypothetical protein [Campylobacter sp.]
MILRVVSVVRVRRAGMSRRNEAQAKLTQKHSKDKPFPYAIVFLKANDHKP